MAQGSLASGARHTEPLPTLTAAPNLWRAQPQSRHVPFLARNWTRPVAQPDLCGRRELLCQRQAAVNGQLRLQRTTTHDSKVNKQPDDATTTHRR